MADEITYDRVEDAEQNILEAISGVGDTVDGLPASLETDFTEVKNAIADVKTDVGNVDNAVGNVNTAVSDVKSDTSSIKNTVDTNPLLAAGSAVKSVQRGILSKQTLGAKGKYYINISTVDVNKSLLINSYLGDIESDRNLFSVSLESNRIVIDNNNSKTVYFGLSWQVIEFY